MTSRRARRPEELSVSRHVAAQITAARTRLGMSQHNLADALTGTNVHLARSVIAAIEGSAHPHTPARAITVDELCALAQAMDVTATALLYGPNCGTCHDAPPPGLTCNACGAGTNTALEDQ